MSSLVNYSSSSSSDEEPLEPTLKRIKLPVPFEPIKSNDSNDDPEKHCGRKRQIPHVTGNWSSHLFINCEHLASILEDFFEHVKETTQDIEIIEAPHVSLSKNFIVKYHWIDNLTKVLSQNLKFKTFQLKFSTSSVQFLSNEDSSRHFACLLVNNSCNDDLERLIEVIDQSLKEFDLPSYYENRIFHSSIIWKLTEFTEEEKLLIRRDIFKFVPNEVTLDSTVEKITLKTGNKIKFFNCL